MTTSKGVLVFILTLGFSFALPSEIADQRASPCSTSEGKLRWFRMHSGNLHPPEALTAGFEIGQHAYISRGYHNNYLIPGKYVASTRLAYLPLDGKEILKTDFEILIGYEARWVTTQSNHIPSNAFVAGYENNDQMYVCRAIIDNALVPGKLSARLGTCYLPWYGEKSVTSYEVLVVP